MRPKPERRQPGMNRAMSFTTHAQVSLDNELLILVDDQDNVTGYDSKQNAHLGAGLLHRAFSVFLFSEPDRVLLQRRSGQKMLWPLFWSNSCCSHPRKGETYEAAAHRRLIEELGITAELMLLYRFEYAAAFEDRGSERELCAVFVGWVDTDCPVRANENEIAEWKWVRRRELDTWVQAAPGQFTPWFLLEWARLTSDQQDNVLRLRETRDTSAAEVPVDADYSAADCRSVGRS